MKFNKFLLRILCLTLILAVACGVAAKLHVDNKEYKVEFDANGGTGVAAQYIVKGGLVTAPQEPTRDGYTFLGWFHNEDEFDFKTPVKGAMTLVAHWEKLPAECPHADKDDDGKCDACGVDFKDGDDLPKPEAVTYSIVYMDGATKLDLAPNSYNSASTGLVLPYPAEKAHFVFDGWYLDAEFTTLVTDINVNAGTNLVFYAKYSPITYKVDYELNGGVNAEGNVLTYTVNDLPVVFTDPTKEGYEFKGWFTEYTLTTPFTGITAENAGNFTLFAKWEKILVPHTITYYDHNYQELFVDTFYESDEDQPLRASYELPGYTFNGWAHPRMTWVTLTCIPAGTTEDIAVIALMEKVIITHTLTYVVNGEVYHSVQFNEEEGVESLLAINDKGYAFDGWYATPELTGDKVTSIAANSLDDVTVYASNTAIKYTVTFIDCDTKLELALTEYTISNEAILLPALPEKFGWAPMGWYDNFQYEGASVNSIAAGTVGDLTFYAKYSNIDYTFYFHNGETTELVYNYGDTVTLPGVSNKEGYLFAGWYTDAEFTGEALENLDALLYSAEPVHLYAKWLPYEGVITPEVPFA